MKRYTVYAYDREPGSGLTHARQKRITETDSRAEAEAYAWTAVATGEWTYGQVIGIGGTVYTISRAEINDHDARPPARMPIPWPAATRCRCSQPIGCPYGRPEADHRLVRGCSKPPCSPANAGTYVCVNHRVGGAQ